MNLYRIVIKKGDETQAYDLESEETSHALAYRLWKENFSHQPTQGYEVNVGREGYIPCSVIDDSVYSGPADAGLWLEPENKVAVTDESYTERQKRAQDALATLLAAHTTPPGLCTYHITIKRGDQVQEYDMDSSEYYIDVTKRLWKENFSHKPTQRNTVSAHPPGGYYVPRHIIDDGVDDRPPENAVWVDGDPDPKRRCAIREAMEQARAERIKSRGMIAYHVTIKQCGKVVREYELESDEGAARLCRKIWRETFGSESSSFWLNRGHAGLSHHESASGKSVTVEKKKKQLTGASNR